MPHFFKFKNFLRFLTLSTALSFSHLSLAGLIKEDPEPTSKPFTLPQNIYENLGILTEFPVKIVGHIREALDIDESSLKIALANTAMFHFMLGCTREDIYTLAFSDTKAKIPQKRTIISTKIYNSWGKDPSHPRGLDFKIPPQELQKMPLYVWKGLTGGIVYNLPLICFRFLKSTNIHTVELFMQKIGNEGVRSLAENFQGTNVHTVILRENQIEDEGARDFAKKLKDTKVHTVNFSDNGIGDETKRFIQATYPHIKWIFT